MPDPTPFADWPRHLQASWRDCVERGEVDGHTPPTSVVEAYLQVAEAQGRRLAGIPWGDGRHDLADDEELMLAELPPTRATCASCGARELEHFYTAKAGCSMLCPGCFQARVVRGVAREANLDTQPTCSLSLDNPLF